MEDLERLKARMQPVTASPSTTEPEKHAPRPKQAVLETMEFAAEGLLRANKEAEAQEEAEQQQKQREAKVAKETPKERTIRQGIEKRCRPMNFGDLILSGRVTQDVPVLPGKMTVTFRSLTGADSFWVERNSLLQPVDLRNSWALYHQLAMSVSAINGVARESYTSDTDAIREDVVRQRLELLLGMNTTVIEMLIANMGWFFERVRNLFDNDFEAIKNG